MRNVIVLKHFLHDPHFVREPIGQRPVICSFYISVVVGANKFEQKSQSVSDIRPHNSHVIVMMHRPTLSSSLDHLPSMVRGFHRDEVEQRDQ